MHKIWIALISGMLLPCAFAPCDIYPLGFIAPLAIYLISEESPPHIALRYGYIFGLTYFGIGVSWIFISIHEMGHLPVITAGFLTLLLIGFLSIFPALQSYVIARFFAPKVAIHAVLTFPAVWVSSEIFRSWIFTGFPWLIIGYSQIDAPLGGLAPIFGVLGISFFTIMTGGLLLTIVRSNNWRKQFGWGITLLILWGGAIAVKDIQWTIPSGAPVRMSLIQVAIPQQVRWAPEARLTSIRRYLELTRNNWGAQLIIWPENSLTIFYQDARQFLNTLTTEAQEHGAELLIGLPIRSTEDSKIYYNGLVSLPSQQFYFKRHLVPFTEFLPLKQTFGPLIDFLNAPMSNFSHGPDIQVPLFLAGHKVGVSICYEAAFPDEIARFLPEAEILINVSNDGWFGNSLAPYQNLQMARMRAIESQRWLVRSTNTGISAIIRPSGKIDDQSPLFQDAVVTADVSPLQGQTPYIRFGDAPLWILIIFGLSAKRVVEFVTYFNNGRSQRV